MAETANAFLSSLRPEQLSLVRFDFTDEERLRWHFVPTRQPGAPPSPTSHPRKGLRIMDMQPYQRHLANALLCAGLSQRGYIKATSIMSLEDVLRVMENDDGVHRNPEAYFFCVFGEPSERGTWGYRVEGHHVSQHFTIVNGRVIGSPSFFGANPARVPYGPRKGQRVLAREEDLGRDLVQGLTPSQKELAIVDAVAYPDIKTMASRKAALMGEPSGLQVSQMNGPQKQMLQNLLDEYCYNMPDELAKARQEQVTKSGDDLYFAWAGSEEVGKGHYYRVQSPFFLIEYDHTQNEANHIHSVWRDFEGDFGLDLLKRHYESSHR